jgi:hypothetical protein
MRVQGIAALAVVALAVAACGGGGGGGSTGTAGSALPTAPAVVPSTAPATAGPLPAGYLVANVTITIPKGSFTASTRRAQTVGTGTQSITFQLLQFNGASVTNPSTQAYGLTSTSPGCSVNAVTGNLNCSLNIDAPIGSDIFLAQTFTGANGSGSLTGSGAVQLSVAQNASNAATLSLSGQVASVFLAASGPYLGSVPTSVTRRSAQSTTFSSLRLFVTALDSAGNPILNPTVFTTPVYLQLFYPDGGTPDVSLQVVPGSEGGATTSTSLNFGSVAVFAPTDTITATLLTVGSAAPFATINSSIGSTTLLSSPAPYPTPLAGALSFFVTEPAAPSGTILIFDPGYGEQPQAGDVTSIGLVGLNEHTLTVSEVNFFGTFTVTDPSCAGIATLSFSGSSLLATGLAPGSCSATISDGLGNQIVAPVTVTTTSVTGS